MFDGAVNWELDSREIHFSLHKNDWIYSAKVDFGAQTLAHDFYSGENVIQEGVWDFEWKH